MAVQIMEEYLQDIRKVLAKIDNKLESWRSKEDNDKIIRLLFEAIGMVNSLEGRKAIQNDLYEAMHRLDTDEPIDCVLGFVRDAVELVPDALFLEIDTPRDLK